MFATFIKYLSWFCVPSLILAWCGALIGGLMGAGICFGIGLFSAGTALFLVERLWIREFSTAVQVASPGLAVSARAALQLFEAKDRLPHVVVLQTPHPMVLCARRAGGLGTVWVSSGALGSWSEPEVRDALARAFRRLKRRDEPIRGIAAWLNYRYLESTSAPRSFKHQLRWVFLRWMGDAMDRLAPASGSTESVGQSPTWSVIYTRLSV